MKGFIEVHHKNGVHLLNVKHIEDVWEDNTGKCTIWLALNTPDSTEQDMITPRESYDEVKRMIEEAMG